MLKLFWDRSRVLAYRQSYRGASCMVIPSDCSLGYGLIAVGGGRHGIYSCIAFNLSNTMFCLLYYLHFFCGLVSSDLPFNVMVAFQLHGCYVLFIAWKFVL